MSKLKKSAQEHLTDILNAQLVKKNISEAQVKDEHKSKIKKPKG